MNKLRIGFRVLVCVLTGVSVILLLDLMSLFLELNLSMKLRFVMLAVSAGLAFAAGQKSMKKVSVVLTLVLGAVLAILAGFYGCLGIFSNTAVYWDADTDGRKSFFADQRVMLIVPHQDDEVNVMGGSLEEYVRNGSEVYVVYFTNGDLSPVEKRYSEAIACLAKQGVPEDHVIFLGYGDQWMESPHLYNSGAGEIRQSMAGFYATYGTNWHPAYREGREYTVDNLLADMESVILEYRPDVIFCSDYDAHGEHKATTLVFEKAMGRILKRSGDYQPKVYKGYAYRTAWFAPNDFYAQNILPTSKYYQEEYVLPIDHYRWEDRICFPVIASGLSRSLPGSGQYDLLKTHVSQEAHTQAQHVINGDRVFWERFTTSLCSRADISVSSGNGSLLNDFMLLETGDLLDGNRWPCDGTWSPDASDTEKKATVVLPERADLTSIVLYDNPEPGQNVLDAVITFDNGTSIVTGPLDPMGATTVIEVDQKQVLSFSVELTKLEGIVAGVTEIEAFSGSNTNDRGFIQLMDQEETFAYDYITDCSGQLLLQVYSYGSVPELSPEHYTVTADNDSCSVNWSEQGIQVFCPQGEAVTISVTAEGEKIWDRAYIRNPGKLGRLWIRVCQHGEILAEELREVPRKMEYHLNLWSGRLIQTLGLGD